MKSWKNYLAWSLVVAVVSIGAARADAEEVPKIPGAGGGSSTHDSVIEGTLDKYDSVLNKLSIKGIGDDKMTLDAVPSLKAKGRHPSRPDGYVKQGRNTRGVFREGQKESCQGRGTCQRRGGTRVHVQEDGEERQDRACRTQNPGRALRPADVIGY